MKRLSWILVLACGCFRAPDIVLVDRATALEQQAGGSFEELERKLMRTGTAPRPVPLTPEELEKLGIKSPPLIEGAEKSEADELDDLLRRHCVGEANDGTVIQTPTACRAAIDQEQVSQVMEQVNQARLQLWRWMHNQKPNVAYEDLRKAWIRAHVKGVICGGWLQREDGVWEEKKC